MHPFEYYKNVLGVQNRYLFDGKGAADESLKFIGERGLQHRIKEQKIIRLRYQGPHTHALIRFDTLPIDWQNALIERFGEPEKQSTLTLFEKLFERDTNAYNHYLDYKKVNGSRLEDSKIEEYTINASVLNLITNIREMRKNFRSNLKGSTQDIWTTIVTDCNLFRRKIEHTLPHEPRPLYNKWSLYKKDGYDSLVHKGVCNENRKKVSPFIESFLNDLFSGQQDKPTATEIAKQYDGFLNGYVEVINNATGEIYNSSDFPKLSRNTILNYLAEWRNQIGTYTKRSGNRQVLMSLFKPYHSLKMPSMAGSLISIDDRQPPFEYAKGKRVWFYNGIDLGSAAFTTWVFGKTKEGIIIDFYRQMVRNYTEWGLNLPAEIEAESSLNSSFKDTFLREGAMFQYVRIEANNARGKRIEAYYRPLRYELEKKHEGWLARPFALSESNQAGPGPVKTIDYNVIIENCLHDIETWNNMPHPVIKNKTRWEVFLATQNQNIKPTNWRGFMPTLGYATKTSCNAGIIKLQGAEFLIGNDGKISHSDELIRLMDLIEGRNIVVYWLDGNDGAVLKALVYDGDQYICEAIAKPVYNKARIEQTPEDLENRELMSKYVATIEGYQKLRRKSLSPVTVIDNRPLTLNGKFKITIPGQRYNSVTAEEIVEQMPELDEMNDDLISVETTIKQSQFDRF